MGRADARVNEPSPEEPEITPSMKKRIAAGILTAAITTTAPTTTA